METRVHPLLSCAKGARRVARRLTSTSSADHRTHTESVDTGETRAWVRNLGTAAVISSLGIALAGAVATAGTANTTDDAVDVPRPNQVTINDTVRQPDEFSHREGRADRSAPRGALTDRKALSESRHKQIERQQTREARLDRAKRLGEAAKAAKENQKRLSSRVPSQMPLANYTLSARWGAVGPWARYHTGVDLAAPIGSAISAPAAGVVEHAGPGGEAGSWAGCYVVLRHTDGKASLYAHMNCGLSISVGQTVAPGDSLGHVGMTGRSFGPHLHLELYPAGATPGDIYSSIDPLPWLREGE